MSTLKVNNVTDLGDDAVITDGALVGAGKILQVVSTTLTTSVVIGNVGNTPLAVAGLSANITPTSTSNKILVIFSVAGAGINNFGGVDARLFRDSSQVFRSNGVYAALNFGLANIPGNFLDSPSTTSPIDYNIRIGQLVSNGTSVFINRNESNNQFSESTITLMEVAV